MISRAAWISSRLASLGGAAAIALLACGSNQQGDPAAAPSGAIGVDSGSSYSDRDSPLAIDASAEDGPAEHCNVTVDLLPAPTGGTACIPRPGTTCIPDSWFCMSKWSPFYYDGVLYPHVPATYGKREPRQIVRTARFMLDIHPVTNAQYLAYVRATGRAAPPDVLDDAFPNSFTNRDDAGQPTGWHQGEPSPARLRQPVVGVTRAEAQAYCEHVRGRLPTVVEVLRAGQGESYSTARFPWGPRFPYSPLGSTNVQDGFIDKVVSSEYPLHSAVDTLDSDRSPFGVLGLATNVAEWLLSCEEDVRENFMGDAPGVAPPGTFTAMCRDAVLTTNFPHVAPHFMGQRILSLRDEADATETHYLGVRMGTVRARLLDYYRVFPHLPSRPPSADRAGNSVRNFRVGFRCAYDAPR